MILRKEGMLLFNLSIFLIYMVSGRGIQAVIKYRWTWFSRKEFPG